MGDLRLVLAHANIAVMEHGAWERVPIDAQSVEAPLSRSAVFLVMAAGGLLGPLAIWWSGREKVPPG